MVDRLSRGIILLLIFFVCSIAHAQHPIHAEPVEDHVLHGIVRDSLSRQPLAGVTIFLVDIKRGAISKRDGSYRIAHLPNVSTRVRVSLLGYKTIVEQVDLSAISEHDFALTESLIETPEVVVSGVSEATEKKRMPVPISTVTQADLKESAATNIIDAVSKEPGISSISTGPAISKPVIRGLGYNRVLVISDGVRQEGQQWGDEHGVEVDPSSVSSVEILKGPASLMYGSDALAGVVNLLADNDVEDGHIRLSADGEYRTNNGQISTSLATQANLKQWTWDVRYSHQQAHAYQNAYDGYVFGSGFREDALRAVLGYHGSWGYTQLHLSRFILNPGIVEGMSDSSGAFVREVAASTGVELRPTTHDDALNYESMIPYQHIVHSKVNSETTLFLGGFNLLANIGWQQNERQEFASAETPSTPGLAMTLGTLTYDLRGTGIHIGNAHLSVGFNGMAQDNRNTGAEYLIPDYHLFDFGAYAVSTLRAGSWDLSAGLRYDLRSERSGALYLDSNDTKVPQSAPDATQRFVAHDYQFGGVAGSLGASYQASDDLTLKFNLGRGFRAPNMSELAANGVHDGTVRYELGNSDLRPEFNTQVDVGLLYQITHLSIEASVFANSVDHYIYTRKVPSLLGGDSLIDGNQVFAYDAASALLYGAELLVDIHPHPLDWLHFENGFGFVITSLRNQADSMQYLPFSPAPKWTSTLKTSFKHVSAELASLDCILGADIVFAQHNIYSAFNTETATASYVLIHAGVISDWQVFEHQHVQVSLLVNNLGDVAYQDHLSRLKYLDTNEATGRMGVFGVGRSFVLRLSIPLDIIP